MGDCFSCCEEFVSIKPVENSADRTFKSRKLSAPIKDNKTDVKQGYEIFSENETNNCMEILSRQAAAISREVMIETLTTWKNELKLDSSDYDDLNELFDFVKDNHWPQHLKVNSPWETTQPNAAMTNWLYFYVSRTDADSDVQKFNLAICHLITKVHGISRDVLIGGLCKKGLLLEDGEDIYLNFPSK